MTFIRKFTIADILLLDPDAGSIKVAADKATLSVDAAEVVAHRKNKRSRYSGNLVRYLHRHSFGIFLNSGQVVEFSPCLELAPAQITRIGYGKIFSSP